MPKFACARCRHPQMPDPRAFAARVCGPRWWTCDLATILGAIVWVSMPELCGNHASLLADLVIMAWREERGRHITPGTVEVRYATIAGEHELLPAVHTRRAGEGIVDRVTQFVAGTILGALVEIDLEQRCARVTLHLDDDERTISTVIESRRLVHLSAVELAASLRRAEPSPRAR